MIEWILYPPPQGDKIFEDGDQVFIRTKSKREIGRKGQIVDPSNLKLGKGDDCKETKGQKLDSIDDDKRLHVKIPIHGREQKDGDNSSAFYTTSFRPSRLIPLYRTSQKECTIIVTKTTEKYRLLAASQLNPDDHVLEIGCSNGECSLIISKYLKQGEGTFIGFDVSQEMIDQAQGKMTNKGNTGIDSQYGHVQFHTVNVFTQPKTALKLATLTTISSQKKDDINAKNTPPELMVHKTPTVVFIDIGGNRDLNSVLRMISWVKDSFSPLPRLIIIKSEETVESIEYDHEQALAITSASVRNNEVHGGKRLKIGSIRIEPCGRIKCGEEWFQSKLKTVPEISDVSYASTQAKKYSHPKKAHFAISPEDGKTPICRYYNYHKNGCIQSDCPYDHLYCHWCLQKGHKALNCQNPQVEALIK
jgi:SAM-dependent methyltransferase